MDYCPLVTFNPRSWEAQVTETEIRTALIDLLASRGDLLLFEEFVAHSGRLDVLAVGDTLSGYEIKSDLDSLARIPSQLAVFSGYCDTLTFAAGPKLAFRLLKHLPAWCGVMLAYRFLGGVRIVRLREAFRNPLVDARVSLALLRKTELQCLLTTNAGRSAKTKQATIGALLSTISFRQVREHLAHALRRRAAVVVGEQ